MKIAIAIIVKDEAADILPWICWYFNLRASTIIFYDDNSTDGTFELASAACDVRDVRVHRVPPSIDSHTHRQKQSYFNAIAEYGDEFDWIGFFDADEYLALPHGQDLLKFLDRPEDVGAVAINWCNYGSSGYVLKPRMPPFYAYNKHYNRGEAINRHVKTFVRPKHWVKQWHNPHFFDVHPLRYEDPTGRPISWTSVSGIMQDEARWDGAKLMHYQCRSMEHFIERVRKRPDIVSQTSLWIAYDHNDVEDNTPRQQYENVAVIMRSIVRASIARIIQSYCEPLPGMTRVSARPNFNNVSSSSRLERSLPTSVDSKLITQVSVKICRVITYFKTSLARSSCSMRVSSGIASPHKEEAVFAIVIFDLPGMLFLLEAVDREEPLLIEEDPRTSNLLAYEIVQLDEPDCIALRHPTTGLFLSCEPPEITGGLSASRHFVNNWERFKVEDAAEDGKDLGTDSRVELIRAFASGSRNFRQFLREHRDTRLDILCTIFPVLVLLAAKEERKAIRELCGATSQYIF